MMHFPPCFRFPPYFRKSFLTFWKIYKILPFPDKISHFHPQKFLTTIFFTSTTNFGFPPFFACFTAFPSDSRKFIIPPLLFYIPPCFRKILQLFTYFTCN